MTMSFDRLKGFAKRRPKELVGTLVGAAAGLPVGVAIRGIGIAAVGGAIGVPAIAFFGVVGATKGNRVGAVFDRPVNNLKCREG